MKTLYSILLTIGLSLFHNKSSAQQVDGFLNVLTQVPKFFTEWISKTNEIAKSQDKEKFSEISLQLYRDIDKLIIAKRHLIDKIQNNTTTASDFNQELYNYLQLLGNFNNTLQKSEKLSRKLGLSAVKLTNGLNADFLQKEWLIEDIQRNPTKKAKAVQNLNTAIKTLEDAKLKIDTFITALNKT